MPKVFQEMDPDLARKLIEGYPPELEGEFLKRAAFYRQFNCPRCGGACGEHFISVAHAISEDMLPRSGLKCSMCDCVFDPHSGLIIELGNLANINERVPPTLTPSVDGRTPR